MARENVMSTPIFDQLLREMAQRAEQPYADGRPATRSPATARPPEPESTPEHSRTRRRHRAE
jgi:hypothetical protein